MATSIRVTDGKRCLFFVMITCEQVRCLKKEFFFSYWNVIIRKRDVAISSSSPS